MRISDVAATAYHQVLQDKDWKFARGALSANESLIIAVTTDNGITGHGYAVQGLHIGETIEGMRQVVEAIVHPLLVGRDPFDLAPMMSELERAVASYTRTKAAVEIALQDILGKALQLPVYALLGGSYRKSIPVIRLLPIKTPREMASNAESVVREGFSYLKVKVGMDARLDVARVREVRSAVGPEVRLTLDANQGWSVKEAVDTLRRVEAFDVSLVEQPVVAHDLAGLALVRRSTSIVVEADESADSLGRIAALIRADCVDAVNLKSGRLGGLSGIKRGAALCEAANLQCRVGFSGASRLNAAADMHAIASTPNIDFACEVGEFTRMESDPFEGVEVENGELRVPEEPGIGVRLRDDVA